MYHEAEYNPQQKKAIKEDVEKMVYLINKREIEAVDENSEDTDKDLELLRRIGLYTNIKADRWLKDGSEIKIGELTFKTLETPGHSIGSLCFYSNEIKEIRGHLIDGVIFTGDLLFKRYFGEFNIPNGNKQSLFSSIKNKIMNNPNLTDHFKIFGGHLGDTTIGEERLFNPFRSYFL